VAALLRLQARRIESPEGRAALEEAVRRVGSIAIVHDTLSQTLDESVAFDEVADRLRVMVAEVSSSGAGVTSTREGSFGTISAEVATPLAMVLTELLQNAVEHGFAGGPGTLVVRGQRLVGRLHVSVEDDGAGLPEGFDAEGSASLGLSIVRTLVESELGGQLKLGPGSAGGTRVQLDIPLA
jgi:two-component sensor histidine kinase